jgi:hypothetical protein
LGIDTAALEEEDEEPIEVAVSTGMFIPHIRAVLTVGREPS